MLKIVIFLPKKMGRGNFGLSFFFFSFPNSSVIRQFLAILLKNSLNFFNTFMAKLFLNQAGAILFHSKKSFYGNFKNIFFDDEFHYKKLS